jgi:hypothetical protein
MKKNHKIIIVILLIAASLLLFNKYGRTGLSDYVNGLDYDSMNLNNFVLTPNSVYNGVAYNDVYDNLQWKVYGTGSASYDTTNHKLLINSGSNTGTGPTPIMNLISKQNFYGRNVVLNTICGQAGGGGGAANYPASCKFFNIPIQTSGPSGSGIEAVYELRWSKINPDNYAIFKNGLLIQEATATNKQLYLTASTEQVYCGNGNYCYGTIIVSYVKYTLPFNCELDPGQVKVYEVFEPGTQLQLESTKYKVDKFCREFKAEIYQTGSGLTIDAADEIYESLAYGNTQTIPSNQRWALHYITTTANTCTATQELNANTSTCITAQGLADKLVMMQGQIAAQAATLISLNLTITQNAALITSLNLSANQEAALIAQMRLNITDMNNLLTALNANLATKIALVQQLNASNEQQKALLAQMNLAFADQGAILHSLNLTLLQDADIILNLTRDNTGMATLITAMNLSLKNDSLLIDALQLNNEQRTKLIIELQSQLNMSDSQLAELLSHMSINATQVSSLADQLRKSEAEKSALQAEIDALRGESSGFMVWFENAWADVNTRILIIAGIGISIALIMLMRKKKR